MKSRIEQDHEQYPPDALILPRGAAYAPLPQATSAADAVHPHPVTRIGNRRAHSHEAPEGRAASGCRSTPDCDLDPRLPGHRGPRVTCNEPPRPPDVTRNGKGATHVRSISFEGEQGTLVMGGWADRCRRRPPALFAKKDPPPPSSTFRSTRAPRSAVGTPHRGVERHRWPGGG